MMPSVLQRRDAMTSAERMRALVAGEPIDRVPFAPMALGYGAKILGTDLGSFYRDPDTAYASGVALMRAHPWMNTTPGYGWAERGAWEFGGDITWPDNDRYPAPIAPRPVITRPEQVEDLPDPDPVTAGMTPLVARFNELNRAGGFPAGLPAGTPTTMTASVLGRSTFLRWMVRHPDAVHVVQRKATNYVIGAARKTMERYGAENCALFCGVPMESNQLISPGMFETFCKPYIQEILDAYVSAGVPSVLVHLCGDHTLNLPHWRDIPLPPRTKFSIGHEMDIRATSRELGGAHVLGGNMDNAILQAGTPDEVRAEARRCLEEGMDHPGGFMLMPACEFPPFTPRRNVDALEQALADFGFY